LEIEEDELMLEMKGNASKVDSEKLGLKIGA